MSNSIRAATTLALLLAAGAAFAQATPVGLWKTIDDETGKERSHVRVVESGGVLSGRIEKILDPTRQDEVCDLCSGDLKGQKKLGLTILRNVRQNESDRSLWDGGEILDPNNGKTYTVRLKPIDAGRRMEVRGFIGVPLLGRTQVWQRVE